MCLAAYIFHIAQVSFVYVFFAEIVVMAFGEINNGE